MNLEPISTGPSALWFGTGIHLGLGAYYDPETPRDIARAIQEWELHCKSYTGDGEVSPETYELGLSMLEYYGKWAPKHDQFKVLWTEREFKIPLQLNLNGFVSEVLYSFKCDGVAEDSDGRIWILEHKSAASFSSSYDYLSLDDQCGSYILFLQEEMNRPIEGVIYTVLKKKAPQPLRVLKSGAFSVDKNQDTNYAIAYQTIKESGQSIDQYREFLDYLYQKPDNFVHREVVRRNQNEIRALEQSLLWEITDMLHDPKIYRSPSAWNCGQCAYYSPCLQRWEGADITSTLRLNYREREEIDA